MSEEARTQLQSILEQSVKAVCPQPLKQPSIILEIPSDKKHGELSCNVALRLAGLLKQSPMSLAAQLQGIIQKNIEATPLKDKIATIEIKPPGFINFFLSAAAFYDILYQVFEKGDGFGRGTIGGNQKALIEFVSANPTGPLSVAHARQAAVGDALANILKFAGYQVTKEFYLNDEGNQINILGRSIELRAREIFGQEINFPEDGYQGDYIRDMAKKFIEDNKIKNIESLDKKELKDFRQFGVDYLLSVIRQELKDFGVHFDAWSHQSKIATTENIEKVLEFLKEKGFIYEQEGAVWFKSTAFGDDKDRVVRKSDGSFTYLAPDIVYHKNKFERGFDKVINLWGPDHHGYIPRLKAAVAALGRDPKNLEVLIVQLATIFRDGQPLSMSTRRGQYISLREVIDEVGVDAGRFFFLMRRIDAHLDFDLELAKKQTPENPVYYIQYAHARIHSIIEFAKESKLKPKKSALSLLKEKEEIDLIRTISYFPEVISICVSQREPFTLVSYLQELAGSFHQFYDKHRVVSDNLDLASERLGLIDAAKTVLANGLRLLGVSAPIKM